MDPEAKARLRIDAKLEAAGWVIQDMSEFDRTASLGVAVREFGTTNGKEVDYALFIDEYPCGIIEAKRDERGVNLIIDDLQQGEDYFAQGLKGKYNPNDLRFCYMATGEIIQYKDLKDPNPRSHSIYSFHRPEYLKSLIDEYKAHPEYKGTTFRTRLQHFPAIPEEKLWDCQKAAVAGLEKSFGLNRERSLIHMATGAGKTFTAITAAYRLLKFGGAKRILFLVDTNNLGEQAETEFKNYETYDTKKKLSSLYNIERIQRSYIQDTNNVTISTIQRLYSMLCNDLENFVEGSDEERQTDEGSVREVRYNPRYTPEYFDVIFIDECHRSIYHKWSQIFDYFDAFLVGLTATPSQATYAFFRQNVVSEYTHEQAKEDGVNVGSFGTVRIVTEKTKDGGIIARVNNGHYIRDKRKRTERWQETDADEAYEGKDLDRSVVNFNTIQLVLQTFRDQWQKWDFFRDRNEIPKTLIFAKDDSHADDIIRICKEVFDEGDDFCKKITYQSEEKEDTLLHNFRHEFNPRIAVTVSKIATGTDVKCIEILLFMRDIHNENFYEQMLGRARRVLSRDELIQSSPSAKTAKLGYVIVDAVGITESPKMQTRCGGEPKPTIPFKKLLDAVANAETDEDIFQALAGRLIRLDKVLTEKQRKDFKKITEGTSVLELAKGLDRAHNIDEVEAQVHEEYPKFDEMSEDEKKECTKLVIEKRCREASRLINKKEVREFLLKVGNVNDQTIDPALDRLVSSEIKPFAETDVLKSLRDFLANEQMRNEIEALDIIYRQDYKKRPLTEAMIHDLFDKMCEFNASLTQQNIYIAYHTLTKSKEAFKQLADIIQIIRYEWHQIEELEPFADMVRSKFKVWVFEKNRNEKVKKNPFTEEQMVWLRMIRDHIAANASISMEALRNGKFLQMGGPMKFLKLFGNNCKSLLDEINIALAA